jgi:crossover junction endodeoxyribonuclease RusA
MISKEARIYKTIVQTLIMVSRLKKLEGRLSMQIFAYPPDKRKRDLDNLIKVLQDSLQKSGLFNDDSQIDKLYIERKEVKKSGCLEIIIEEIEA